MKKFLMAFYAIIFVALLTIGATTKHHSAGIVGAPALAFVAGFRGSNRKEIIRQLVNDYPRCDLAPGYLRAEQYLGNGVQQYNFPLSVFSTDLATERKLQQQDAFCITDIGIYLLQESTLIAGIGKLQTYPNPFDMPDEAAAGPFPGFVGAHLEHIYNGSIEFKIGQTTYLPALPIKDCRVVRTAQKTAATNATEKHPGDGLISLAPQYDLKGQEQNYITLKVPANAAQLVVSNNAVTNYKYKVVLYAEGFTIVGGSGLVGKGKS